jgi:FkbM family methyltransferase
MALVVIDVGAHDGSVFSLPWSEDLNHTVYAIEPNPSLAERLRSHNRPNLYVFCCTIGEIDETSSFYLNNDDQTSSLPPATCVEGWEPKRSLETEKVIDVVVKRLDTFINEQHLTEVDFLKIDAKGCDLQVLKSAGSLLSSIRRIQLEVKTQSLYQGTSSKAEILDYLSERGFYLTRSRSQTDGLEEVLDFIRIERYPLTKPDSGYFEVNIPYVGKLKTPKGDLVGQFLERGSFEGLEQVFLWLYLRPGDTFFDCGSHVGLFSAVANRIVGQEGSIVGFDPNPVCFELYRNNLEELGCENLLALNVGLSSHDDTADLFLGKPGMSAYTTFASGATEHSEIGLETIKVTQRSLDSIIDEYSISHIHLAKLDVEGWEINVLKGAEKSIFAGLFPVWMVEFTEENATASGSSTRELRLLIEELGYTLCRFDATRLCLIPEPLRPYYLYDNLFAVMNIESVNDRLAAANLNMVNIAKDILARWDLATQRDSIIFYSKYLQTRLEDSQAELQTTQAELQTTQAELQTTQAELQTTQAELQTTQAELQTTQAELEVMRSRKFWKM